MNNQSFRVEQGQDLKFYGTVCLGVGLINFILEILPIEDTLRNYLRTFFPAFYIVVCGIFLPHTRFGPSEKGQYLLAGLLLVGLMIPLLLGGYLITVVLGLPLILFWLVVMLIGVLLLLSTAVTKQHKMEHSERP